MLAGSQALPIKLFAYKSAVSFTLQINLSASDKSCLQESILVKAWSKAGK